MLRARWMPDCVQSASMAASDPASAGFVNLQLETQDQGRLAWTGQLLPGQGIKRARAQ